MENTSDSAPEVRGNNADWFLELLGVEPGQPSPIAPARSETSEMSFTLDDTTSSVSTPTPLELPTNARPTKTKGDLETEEPPDLGDWRPEALAHQVLSKRNFRWSIVVTVGVIVLIAVVAALWLPSTVEAEARDEAADYEAVIDALRATLADTQQTLAAATEPATSGIDLFPLSAQLTRVDAAAAEVGTRAARPLPDTLPLLSRAPLESLEPTRTTMKVLSDQGMNIVERISATISYRTTLDGILSYPSLPVRADANQIDGLSVSLAESLAQSSFVLAALSLDPAFDAHRLQVAGALDSFETWQTAYLDALRQEDQAATAALVMDAADLRSGIFSSIVPALATIRSEVDAAIIDLNQATTDAIGAIPR